MYTKTLLLKLVVHKNEHLLMNFTEDTDCKCSVRLQRSRHKVGKIMHFNKWLCCTQCNSTALIHHYSIILRRLSGLALFPWLATTGHWPTVTNEVGVGGHFYSSIDMFSLSDTVYFKFFLSSPASLNWQFKITK